MKILVIADEPEKKLWDYFDKSRIEGIDLIISCGDLPPQYLSFLVTFSNCPLFYVPGNHDGVYDTNPPEGCVCIDNKIIKYNGLNIVGFGGSVEYVPGPYRYTEKRMRRMVYRLWPKIWLKGGCDILVTHSAAFELGDAEDFTHRGFHIFRTFLDKFAPKYMLHGHVHLNYGRRERIITYNNTTIVNGYKSYILEV